MGQEAVERAAVGQGAVEQAGVEPGEDVTVAGDEVAESSEVPDDLLVAVGRGGSGGDVARFDDLRRVQRRVEPVCDRDRVLRRRSLALLPSAGERRLAHERRTPRSGRCRYCTLPPTGNGTKSYPRPGALT